jgi:hypothetical protein
MLTSKVKLALLALGAACAPAFTDVVTNSIFSFGPSTDYVDSGQPLRLDVSNPVTATTYNRPYSESVSLTPLAGSNYRGPIVYGGWESSGSFTTASAASQVANGAAEDAFLFRLKSSDSNPASAEILLVSQLASSVAFSDLVSFKFSAYRTGGTSPARAVIQIGDNYYIGANTVTIPTNYPANPLSLDIGIGNWLNYDPLTSIAVLGTAATISATSQVSAVGFRLQNNLTTSTSDRSLYVKSLEVTAIPEPGSLSLVLVAGSVCLILRRRMRLR